MRLSTRNWLIVLSLAPVIVTSIAYSFLDGLSRTAIDIGSIANDLIIIMFVVDFIAITRYVIRGFRHKNNATRLKLAIAILSLLVGLAIVAFVALFIISLSKPWNLSY